MFYIACYYADSVPGIILFIAGFTAKAINYGTAPKACCYSKQL